MMKLSKVMNSLGNLCIILMLILVAIFIIRSNEANDSTSGTGTLASVDDTTLGYLLGGVFIAVFVLKFGADAVRGMENSAIRARGRSASAKIIKLSDTGTTINDDPIVKLQLEIYPPGQPSFQGEAQQLISRLQIPMVQPGNTVEVRYDPDSHELALMI